MCPVTLLSWGSHPSPACLHSLYSDLVLPEDIRGRQASLVSMESWA